MSQVIMGTGNYAGEPFIMEKPYCKLYSVEELCYVLVNDAEILDADVMDRGLVKWLDEQCGLNQLAHTLYTMLNQKVSTMAFVGTILEYVGLYPASAVKLAQEVVKSNEGLSPSERKKAKADYLMQSKKYMAALQKYGEILTQLPEEESALRATIYHNMGVANAKLFLYGQAAELFERAYQLDKNEKTLLSYLLALRMHYSEGEYIEWSASHPEYHNTSLMVERMMEQTMGQFDGTDENRMLFTLQICKEDGGNSVGSGIVYYDEIDKITRNLKFQYREMTGEQIAGERN